MIITTTTHVEDKKVTSYEGIVFGEVITGINVFKDFGAGIRNIVGGRSKSYEDELTIARENALAEMESRASAKGANAIIGMKMDYEVLGADNGMLMVTCSGTAVRLTDESDYLG
ncbi:heavy metal-binding domain-containing protein [uncultured Trichococcus sp.]|uniref:heavy metal-binding domain-containing protein n=1 Tax=uncultured Trichococcus sp. TaxID=189665 RepID=UPI0029C71E83|nr:heavy metal-binding domain-containing protein [uncultured Trichococcus sp.]